MRKLIFGAAAATMVVGSTVAHAAPVADARVASPVAEGEELAGSALWLGLLAAGGEFMHDQWLADDVSDRHPRIER